MKALLKHVLSPFAGGGIMLRRWLTALVLFTLFTACQPREENVVIPTLMVLPTLTITNTPSNTPLPTWTFTYTPSETPSNTPTFTLTPSNTPLPTRTFSSTFTPTFTFTPTSTSTFTTTFTPSNTYTPSLTPSNTFTPTFTPSDTPVPTATSAAQIITFGANSTTVTPGSSLRLAWNTVAEVVRIEQLDQNGAITQTYPPQPATGSLIVSIPGNLGRLIQYRIVALRAGVEVSETIPITIICAVGWFFGDQYAPPGTNCPSAVGVVGTGAFQRFENGLMIYINANGLNRIYGLQNSEARYTALANGWDGSTIRSDPAPTGRFIPERMFNWAYYNTLAPIGSWNSAIGWATAAIDNNNRIIQWEGSVGGTGPFYIDAPNAEVYRFSGGDAGTWTRIK